MAFSFVHLLVLILEGKTRSIHSSKQLRRLSFQRYRWKLRDRYGVMFSKPTFGLEILRISWPRPEHWDGCQRQCWTIGNMSFTKVTDSISDLWMTLGLQVHFLILHSAFMAGASSSWHAYTWIVSLRNHLQSAYLGSLGKEVGQRRFSLKAALLSPMSPIGDHFLSPSGFQRHVIFFK